MVKAQENWLHAFGIDYTVEVVDAYGFVARPRYKLKKLQISKQAEYYFFSLESSIQHKFGFTDTSQPGDIMKPSMYFAYSIKVKKLSPNERLRLLVGKISIEDLSKYSQYRGRWDDEKLEEIFLNR